MQKYVIPVWSPCSGNGIQDLLTLLMAVFGLGPFFILAYTCGTFKQTRCSQGCFTNSLTTHSNKLNFVYVLNPTLLLPKCLYIWWTSLFVIQLDFHISPIRLFSASWSAPGLWNNFKLCLFNQVFLLFVSKLYNKLGLNSSMSG